MLEYENLPVTVGLIEIAAQLAQIDCQTTTTSFVNRKALGK
ncbi:hypothetical protein EMIT0324P_90165 [Pseudomonas chlororaphis]